MKAILCSQYGDPELLALADVDPPVAGPGEVLVKVAASSVNFPDVLMVQGRYQVTPELPFIPGSEAAGTVIGAGAGVNGFEIGQRVAVLTRTGAFAEIVAASAASAMLLPDDVPFAFAATFNVVYGTAYLALCRQAAITAEDTVLVLGAAGGVGLAAIEIAKARGARVIAAASSPEKLATAAASGADILIDYGQQDLKSAVRDATGPRGVDVVFDPVGDRLAEPALRCLAWEGRYLVIGFAGGDIPRLRLNLLLLKNASAIGTFWGDWVARNPDLNRQNVADIFAMRARGEIAGRAGESFPLAATPTALRRMLDRKVQGKVLIDVALT